MRTITDEQFDHLRELLALADSWLIGVDGSKAYNSLRLRPLQATMVAALRDNDESYRTMCGCAAELYALAVGLSGDRQAELLTDLNFQPPSAES